MPEENTNKQTNMIDGKEAGAFFDEFDTFDEFDDYVLDIDTPVSIEIEK